MKIILYFAISVFAILVAGCRAEKPLSHNANEVFFSPEKTSVSSIGIMAPSQNEKGLLLIELKKNNIPFSNPGVEYPTWRQYARMVQEKEPSLSNITRQFCAQQFLENYIVGIAKSDKDAISFIKNEITLLTSNQFQNYELLYSVLLVMQQAGEKEFVDQSKASIIQYAHPVLKNPQKDHPDDPRLLQNEKLKTYLDKKISELEKNDRFIEKIRNI